MRTIHSKLPGLLAAIGLTACLSATALGQDSPSHRRYTATFQHQDELPRRTYPRGQFTRAIEDTCHPSRGSLLYTRAGESNCHPNRGSLLARTVQAAGEDAFADREAWARISALRKGLTNAERKESAQQFHIAANERKYQEQQARQAERLAARARHIEASRLASAR